MWRRTTGLMMWKHVRGSGGLEVYLSDGEVWRYEVLEVRRRRGDVEALRCGALEV